MPVDLTPEQLARWPDTWPEIIVPRRLPEYDVTLDEAATLCGFRSRSSLYHFLRRHGIPYLVRKVAHKDLREMWPGTRPYRLAVLTRKQWLMLRDAVYEERPAKVRQSA